MERGGAGAARSRDAARAGDLFLVEQSAIVWRVCIIVSSYLIIDTDEIFARYFATFRYRLS